MPRPNNNNSAAAKVGEIFREAGSAFNKLSEMTNLLHPMGEAQPGGKWTDDEIDMLRSCVHRFALDLNKLSQHIKSRTVSQIRTTLKKKAFDDAGIPVRQVSSNQGHSQMPPQQVVASPMTVVNTQSVFGKPQIMGNTLNSLGSSSIPNPQGLLVSSQSVLSTPSLLAPGGLGKNAEVSGVCDAPHQEAHAARSRRSLRAAARSARREDRDAGGGADCRITEVDVDPDCFIVEAAPPAASLLVWPSTTELSLTTLTPDLLPSHFLIEGLGVYDAPHQETFAVSMAACETRDPGGGADGGSCAEVNVGPDCFIVEEGGSAPPPVLPSATEPSLATLEAQLPTPFIVEDLDLLQVTLNMLNATESEVDVEGLNADGVKLDFDVANNDEVAT